MAIVINDRDVALQASTIRIISAETIIAASSSSFSTKGTTTTPSSISLACPTPGRTSAIKTWEYALSSAPNTWIPLASGESVVITNDAFTTAIGGGSYISYRCTVTEPLYTNTIATYSISYSSVGASAYTVNVLNGVRAITYSAVGSTPTPAQTAFSCSVYQDGEQVTNITSYAWSASGNLSGTSTSATFTPTMAGIYSSAADTKVTLTIVVDGTTIVETIPITATKQGAGPLVLEVSGGVRTIGYNALGTTPTPAQTAFSCTLKQDGVAVTINTYSWSAVGVLSGTSTTSTFTPTAAGTHSTTDTKVSLSVTSGTPAVTTTLVVPIVVTKVGDTGAAALRTAIISAYAWSNTGKPAHSQAITYTWSTSSFSAVYPSGWVSAAAAAPGTGYTLYQITLTIKEVTSGSVSTTENWSNAISNTIGYRNDGSIGPQGASHRTAYYVTTSSTPPGPPTSSGDNPPGGWSFTATSTLSTGYYMYQSDGIYNAQTNTITWNNPYLSNLKVGSLSAISATLGAVTAGSITASTISASSISGGSISGTDISGSGNLDIRGKVIITGNSNSYQGSALFVGAVTGLQNNFGVNVFIPSTSTYGSGISVSGSPDGTMSGIVGNMSSASTSIHGHSTAGYGIVGTSSSSYSGYFSGGTGVYISGNLTVTGTIYGYASSSGIVDNPTYASLKCGVNNAAVQEDSNFVYYKNSVAYWLAPNTQSDKRLKNHIGLYLNALDTINKISVVYYTWKPGTPGYEKIKDRVEVGIYAQDIQKILPNVVEEVNDTYLLNKIDIIPYLVRAIQELDLEVKHLKGSYSNEL